MAVTIWPGSRDIVIDRLIAQLPRDVKDKINLVVENDTYCFKVTVIAQMANKKSIEFDLEYEVGWAFPTKIPDQVLARLCLEA